MKNIIINQTHCDKTYQALSKLDTYEIFENFDHECKITWRNFCNLVKNIEKIKHNTIHSLEVMYSDNQIRLTERKEMLNHLCEVFCKLAHTLPENTDYIIFKQENN